MELIIMPAIEQYGKSLLKILPKLNPVKPYLSEKDLNDLSLDQLLKVMDVLVNLESLLTTHTIKDMDRKSSHKASLSILSKIKPSKHVDPENFGFMGLGFGQFGSSLKPKPTKPKPSGDKSPKGGDWLFGF